MGDLEAALARAAPGRAQAWAAELSDRLDALRKAFDRHVELTEAPTGFLAEIVDTAPRLANTADKLRSDHSSIAEAIDSASVSVRAVPEGPAKAIEDTREGVVQLLQLLVRHRQRGADLVYEAYSVDIEAGD